MARDEKEHPNDLDGWRKNVAKLAAEHEKVQAAVRAAREAGSHDPLMDSITEAARASPYYAAHVAVAVVVVLVVIAIVGWIL